MFDIPRSIKIGTWVLREAWGKKLWFRVKKMDGYFLELDGLGGSCQWGHILKYTNRATPRGFEIFDSAKHGNKF